MDSLDKTKLAQAIIQEASAFSDLNDDEIDEHQFYVQKCGFFLAHTLTWCRQLELAAELMMNFDYAKKINASRGHHLVFSVENYLIRLSSVYDRVLQLVNVVFHLGVNEEHVSHSLIVTNYKVKHWPAVVRRIKAIKKYLDDYSQARHTLVHRHSLLDARLRRIELFYLNDPEVVYPDPVKARNFKSSRANYLREYAIEKKVEFAKINRELEELLFVLFEELHGEYQRQKSAFSARGL